MKISFNGAARTVTGSQYLLAINGHNLLLECGLFQGKREDTYTRNLTFKFKPGDVDAVVLSHAHVDHCGNLPNLAKDGYHAPIYTTPATGKLTDILLRDSARVQEADVAFVNKKRAMKGEPPVEPLYTEAEAEAVAQHIQPVPYEQSFEPVPGVTARFVDAGHILGSAAAVLDIAENGRKFRLWFSGDIGRLNLPLLRDPVLPEAADYLIMESTYGDKPHSDIEAAYMEFREVLLRTIKRGGKVIIPAFAVGRTQELVYDLNRMISEGEVPAIPVYVDSPLAVNTSDVFKEFAQDFDEETKRFVQEEKHPALSFDKLIYTRSVDESKAINNLKGPLVIISASGMAETGRILHHLRNNIEDERNTILIVSWQAPDTLGRLLADQAKSVRIFGETFERKAEVVTIGGLSAHAGQDFLVKYAQSVQKQVRQVFLVHGEEKASLPLLEKLVETGFDRKIIAYPDLYETVEI